MNFVQGGNNIKEKNCAIKFRVKSIGYRDKVSRYSILKCTLLSIDKKGDYSKDVTVKGVFPLVFKGDEMKGNANYILNDRYGYSFELLQPAETILPENEKSLASFLQNRVYRLGKKNATAIVDKLGMDSISKIKESYTCLIGIGTISSEKKAREIQLKLENHKIFEELVIYLQILGIEVDIAVQVYNKFEELSYTKIRDNPYSICYDDSMYSSIPFRYAEIIAKSLKMEYNNFNRIKTGLYDFIGYRTQNFGDVCVKKDFIMEAFNEYLKSFGYYKENDIDIEDIEKALIRLKSDGSIKIETDIDNNITYVYKGYYNYIENKVVNTVLELIKRPPHDSIKATDIDMCLKRYEHDTGFILDPKQKDAVFNSLTSGISILTGGPGTGKTATTNTIVQCIKMLNKDATLTLVAPTGKAANRLKETTNIEAKTIHRELKLHGFAKAKIEAINTDYVFVDEASMVDIILFEKLLSAIGETTRLVIIGDVDQIPSVGAGLILRDLIDSNVIKVTYLTTIFRQAQGSQIVKNSHHIIKGINAGKGSEYELDLTNTEKSNFKFWECTNIDYIKQAIIKSLDKLIRVYNYDISDICVLMPTKIGELGTISLNKLIQNHINPYSKNIKEYKTSENVTFRVGDKIIQLENNYDDNVFNGETGVVIDIECKTINGQSEVILTADFAGVVVKYGEEKISQIDLAYCITIHKSQGSEFKYVICPIHEIQSRSLNRNLFYTGLTRTKELFILIGTLSSLNYAINNVEIFNRTSRVKEKLITGNEKINLRSKSKKIEKAV